MKHGFLKVAAAAPKIRVADCEYNAGVICEELKKAYRKKAKIIVFPELCLTGCTCGDLFEQELLLNSAKEQLLRIADFSGGRDALIFVGLPMEHKGSLYNVAAAVQNGRVLGLIPKKAVPSCGECFEGRYFSPGEGAPCAYSLNGEKIPFGRNLLFETDSVRGLKVGCEIGEDLGLPDPPCMMHAMAGATVLVNLSAPGEQIGRDRYRELMVTSASARAVAGYICSCSGEGESTQDLVCGGTHLIAENGKILARKQSFCGEILYGDLDLHDLSAERRRRQFAAGETVPEYVTVPFALDVEETVLDRKFCGTPFVPENAEEREKRCEKIIHIQSCGLKKRYEHTGCRTAVLGVSGGLDSTLALLVTARTFDLLGLDRKNIYAVTMPCFGTTDRTYENACKLARILGTTLKEIDIREAVRIHFRDIGQDAENRDVTYENSQARERTQVLMDLANRTGGLVIGTGDLSELALGWATYNGDHMSMYGVNSGVPKTLLRYLVGYFAEHSENAGLTSVLQDILDTPVSPELLPPENGVISQKTEETVGPYELHDFFLYYMLRKGYEPAKVYRVAKEAFRGKYDEETVLRWLRVFYRRFFAQQFKRSCLPDGPQAGSVSLSPRSTLRMPSDASVSLWMKQLEMPEPGKKREQDAE